MQTASQSWNVWDIRESRQVSRYGATLWTGMMILTVGIDMALFMNGGWGTARQTAGGRLCSDQECPDRLHGIVAQEDG